MRRGVVTVFVAIGVILGMTAVSEASGVTVTDLNSGATVEGLAQSLAGPGVSISNVKYVGDNRAGGSFTGGASSIGFEDGIILDSGKVQTYTTDPECSQGVEGPNTCSDNSTAFGTPGDTQLSELSGGETHDASVLEFDFVPEHSTVQFSYVFSSDEYNEFVFAFNDIFAFFVNGTNCALVPGTSEPVSINTINNSTHSELYRDNESGSIDSQMDGLTTVLTCNATVTAGQTSHIKLAIADALDEVLDSAVFIQGGSLVSGTQISTSLSGGGQSGEKITVPEGTAVSDNATLSGVNAPNATGKVTYKVYSDEGCTKEVAPAGEVDVTAGKVPASEAKTLSAGTYYWQASYGGDTNNNSSTSKCPLEVETVETVTGGTPATSLAVKAHTGDFADPATVSATLTNSETAGPVSGKSVKFTLNGSETCTGTTGASGEASCSITPGEAAGTYTLEAEFAGDTEVKSSTGSANFVVTKEETALSYTGATSAVNGQPATLSGHLTTDDPAAGTGLAGKTVTFTLGEGLTAQTCTGATDASGNASCEIASVNQTVGSAPVKANFAGDAFYVSAEASSTVSVFEPHATGAFVVGDLSAGPGKTVNFWGAQWAKNNAFSGGGAPSSMKGYASSPTALSCGATWTTSTGNSSSPPATLPSTINVIVSSKVTQKGSTISGQILHIVVVEVKPGYGPAPGHAGNGKIIGSVC
jgi:Bacterial Ig-like domain (group 3)